MGWLLRQMAFLKAGAVVTTLTRLDGMRIGVAETMFS
jgi:hypothetical protein